jgi:hypothetical protein
MKRYLKIVLIPALSLGLLVGCSTSNDSTQETTSAEKSNEVVRISQNINVAHNLNDMKKEADYIFVGKYTKLKKKMNTARDVYDPRKEAKDEYHEGELYEFKVDKVLKGSTSDKTISILISKKTQITDPTDNKKYEVIKPNYIQPKLNQKYILFVNKSEIGDYYVSPFMPYALEVQKNNKVKVTKPDSALKNQTIRVQNKQIEIESDSFGDGYEDVISGKNLQDVVNTIEKK